MLSSCSTRSNAPPLLASLDAPSPASLGVSVHVRVFCCMGSFVSIMRTFARCIVVADAELPRAGQRQPRIHCHTQQLMWVAAGCCIGWASSAVLLHMSPNVAVSNLHATAQTHAMCSEHAADNIGQLIRAARSVAGPAATAAGRRGRRAQQPADGQGGTHQRPSLALIRTSLHPLSL